MKSFQAQTKALPNVCALACPRFIWCNVHREMSNELAMRIAKRSEYAFPVEAEGPAVEGIIEPTSGPIITHGLFGGSGLALIEIDIVPSVIPLSSRP